MRTLTTLGLSVLILLSVKAQQGSLSGSLRDSLEESPVMFASILLKDTGLGTTSDLDGSFRLENLNPGTYTILVTCVGYKDKQIEGIQVREGEAVVLPVLLLQPNTEVLSEVEVKVSALSRKEAAPLSLRSVSAVEMRNSAGGNLDVSRTLRSLPGINTSQGSFSNELMVRGGASFENRFYLEGIELSSINHFSQQGSGGGTRGLINLDYVRRAQVFTGGFPADLGGALSGVFNFEMEDGNPEHLKAKVMLSTVDLMLAADGPLGEKADYTLSYRHSYTGLIMRLLSYPYVSNYDDWYYKVNWKLAKRSTLTFLGIGGYDRAEPNKINIETDLQWQLYDSSSPFRTGLGTNAVKWTQTRKSSVSRVILSHQFRTEEAYKYLNHNEADPAGPLFDRHSDQGELRIQAENVSVRPNSKITLGGMVSRVNYSNRQFSTFSSQNTDGDLAFNKWGFFATINQRLLNRFMLLTAGLRAEGSDYGKYFKNPLNQLSPRLSLSYAFNNQTTLNFNTGLYFQQPPLIMLGFSDSKGSLANQNLKPIGVLQFAAGMEREFLDQNSQLNVELFYKRYHNYPFSIEKGTAYANQAGGFYRIGEEPMSPDGEGRAYGLELYYRQQLFKGFFGSASYTLLWSEFRNAAGEFQPSAADNRHNFNVQLSKDLGGKWRFGARWQWQSGLPYAPLNIPVSSLIDVYEISGGNGVIDYSKGNTERVEATHVLDLRIDRIFTFERWQFITFVDVANALDSRPDLSPLLVRKRDAGGAPLVDPNNALAYQTYLLRNNPSTLLPTIGLAVKF